MRPCRQCRAPIENHAVTCPQCGAAQGGAPKANSDPPPVSSQREMARQLITGLSDLTGLALALNITLLTFPLTAGGTIGYLLAGSSGAVVGVIAAIALLIGIAIWAESGG